MHIRRKCLAAATAGCCCQQQLHRRWKHQPSGSSQRTIENHRYQQKSRIMLQRKQATQETPASSFNTARVLYICCLLYFMLLSAQTQARLDSYRQCDSKAHTMLTSHLRSCLKSTSSLTRQGCSWYDGAKAWAARISPWSM